MIDEGDRLARAGNYVLGLMDDEERERAERDLERDGDFRDAVLSIAERMHVLDQNAPPGAVRDGLWQAISARIAELPQMRSAAAVDEHTPAHPERAGPAAVRRNGPHAGPGWRAALVAASLLAAFALGYLAGITTSWN